MEAYGYQPDKSGIVSLGGFSYQIKVFAMLATQLREGESIGFEKFDDISMESIKPSEIDSLVDANIKTSTKAIQVKKTSLSNSVAKNVLLNWIQLECSKVNVEHYVLYTEKSYGNKIKTIKNIDVDGLIKELKGATGKKNSNKIKVKKLLETVGDEDFKGIVSSILEKMTLEDCSVDETLINGLKRDFAYSSNNEIFKDRLEEYLNQITCEIIKKIERCLPYELSYDNYCKILERIRLEISEHEYRPSFDSFKRTHPIESFGCLVDCREYKQLKKCEISDSNIDRKMLHEFYYKSYKTKMLESTHSGIIGDIETTAYENYEDVKDRLIRDGQDSSYNRMQQTLDSQNEKAIDKQIREGSCIYLTGEDIDDMQISWSDDEN